MNPNTYSNTNNYPTATYPNLPNPSDIKSQSSAPSNQNFYNAYPSANYQDPRYAENILEKNIGRRAAFYMSYNDSLEWRDRIFTGKIIQAGRDYAIVNDEESGKYVLLWTVYLNFVEFDELPIVQ